MMNRSELLQEFERQYLNDEECEKHCCSCDYISICDMLEQIIDRSREQDEWVEHEEQEE